MAFTSKRELIRALWDDWCRRRDKVEESIAYKYFQKIKSIDTASDNDRNRALLAGLGKYGSSDEGERKRLRKKYGKYSLRYACDRLYAEGRLKKADFEAVHEDITEDDKALIRGIVMDFFRNEGVKTIKTKDVATDKNSREVVMEDKDSQSYIDILDMACFTEQMGLESDIGCMDGVQNLDDPDYIKRCQDFYNGMLQSEMSVTCCLPLYIDQRTGAGVFILGSSYFADDLDRTCYPCILNWDEFGKDYDIEIIYGKDEKRLHKPVASEDVYVKELTGYTVVLKPRVFKSVGEAFRVLKSISKNFYSDYRMINLEYLQKADLDGTFKDYFGNGFEKQKVDDKDDDAIIQEYGITERNGIDSMKNEMERKEKAKRFLNRALSE